MANATVHTPAIKSAGKIPWKIKKRARFTEEKFTNAIHGQRKMTLPQDSFFP